MALDPITVEVIQNRLTHIGREAGIVLTRTAASPLAVETKDLGFNVADHLGRTIVYSVWMPRHGTTLRYMINSCQERFTGQIQPGDMFLTNDPHAGSLHVSDLAVLAPVFAAGDLAGWVGCATHHLDMGGMTAGWCPLATDCFQEGLKFSPVKLVRQGQLDEDIFHIYLGNVRVPDLQAHDLKAQIAANHFAREQMEQLISHYGLATIKEAYEEIINFTEEKTRSRIRSIPDGSYYYEDYLDYDEIYKVCCTLTVEGDRMVFDFTGTSPQAKASVNSAMACSVANLHNIFSIMLIPDIPANEGCFRPLEVKLPPGTLLSCQPPAPCSGASIQGGWKMQTVTMGVLTEALAYSDQWWRGTAGWGSALPQAQFSGRNRNRQPFSVLMSESTLQGGGARPTKDGVDACNIAGSTNTSIPNVEVIEQRYPILYLWRGYLPDTEGAGQYRGGLGGTYGLTPYDSQSLELVAFHIGEVVPALGWGGGMPGSTVKMELLRKVDISGLLNQEGTFHLDRASASHLGCKNQPLTLETGDLLVIDCPGGGGWGDPLLRDVAAVWKDVQNGKVSPAKALSVYGVVLEKGNQKVEVEATIKRREALRRQRLACWLSDSEAGHTPGRASSGVDPYRPAHPGAPCRIFWQQGLYQPSCPHCGNGLMERDLAVVRLAARELGVYLNEDGRVLFQGYLCPDCGHLLEVAMKIQGQA